MFIYVFNEEDKNILESAGFPFFRRDMDTGAWILIKEPDIDMPEGVSAIVSPKLIFHGQKGNNNQGGDRHGKG